MFNLITLARKALLAATLALCSAAAMAGPSYLVTINTAAFSGEDGLLDFSLGSDGDAAGSIATLSNFSGNFGAEFDRIGSVSGDLASGLTFTNAGPTNLLTQSVILGDIFSFNITFSGDYELLESVSGSLFAVVLFDANLSAILDFAVQFDLLPVNNGDPAAVVFTASPDTTVTELVAVDVSEPSQLLLMLSALALAGAAMRRSRTLGT